MFRTRPAVSLLVLSLALALTVFPALAVDVIPSERVTRHVNVRNFASSDANEVGELAVGE